MSRSDDNPGQSASRGPLRIGNAEREDAFKALSAHLDAGRLDVEEYGERYAKASLARTWQDLDELFIDLPAPHPRPVVEAYAPAQTSPGRRAPRSQHPVAHRRFPIGAIFPLLPIIAVGLFFVSGAWIVFLVVPAMAMLFGGRSHRHGHCGRPRAARRW